MRNIAIFVIPQEHIRSVDYMLKISIVKKVFASIKYESLFYHAFL